jgi:RNA polymerase sigma-70 factor, ECF subfamily
VGEPVEFELNGRLGLVLLSGDGHRAALSFRVSEGRITRIDAVRNPEKLRRL